MSQLDLPTLREQFNHCQLLQDITPQGELLRYLQYYHLAELLVDYRLSCGWLDCDQVRLATWLYRQPGPAKGTLVLVHGYMDHSGLYADLIQFVLQKGWNLLCYDLPGHGVSLGADHAIEHFHHYADQLQALLKHCQDDLPGPWLLLGQSTGAAIILEHQRCYPQPLTRILLAPLVRPVGYQWIRWQYRLFGWFLNKVPRVFSANSHDADFLAFIRQHDPLQKHWVSIAWIKAMLAWVSTIEHSPGYPQTPLTIVQGTRDETVDWQHNLVVLQRLYPQAAIHLVNGARHHLVNEGGYWRRQVFGCVGAALDSCKPG